LEGTGYVYEVDGQSKRTVNMSDTTWYQEDPTQLRDAQNKLIAFFISEINRDPEVKLARFKYQAMYGAIQFLIFFSAFTILLFLVCRGVTAKIGSVLPANKKPAFYKTAFVRGNLLHETTEYNDSKSLMDHSIGVLPYMGLFGTVIGILMGLPNAAAAITATGPSANESINELFVQLGLAFSTTGMAVVSVIILESIWVLVQHGETNALRNLKAIQAVTAKKNDEKAAKKSMQDQANLIGAAVAKELGNPDNKTD
jgi:biopolymer transport protein ExbB/TolQ